MTRRVQLMAAVALARVASALSHLNPVTWLYSRAFDLSERALNGQVVSVGDSGIIYDCNGEWRSVAKVGITQALRETGR